YVSEQEILSFIHEKEDWIAKVSKKERKKNHYLLDGTNRKEACWLGKVYPVDFIISKQRFMAVEDERIVFYLPEMKDDIIQDIFYRTGNLQLKLMVEERRKEWDDYICIANHRNLPHITLKYMTSRWGSYSPMTHHISLSSRLIHFPVVCLDYVLLHEYAHILEANHSKRFYDIIRMYMPEYKEYSDLLK
ncbi:MAG: DUF45 domain-containing protein, partial [Solobacterium sp.]|nr:DUF45 domain-containing protein [Solobacterium sp.]